MATVEASCARLSLAMLIPLAALAREKQPFTARDGNLLFTATQVETLEAAPSHFGGNDRARSGFHFVVVDVQVRNVGRRAECTDLTADLQASLGVKTHRILTLGRKQPEVNQLLPGEKADGSYTFEVKDGISPLKLILSPTFGLQGCGGGGLGFRSVTLSLPPSGSSPSPSRVQE